MVFSKRSCESSSRQIALATQRRSAAPRAGEVARRSRSCSPRIMRAASRLRLAQLWVGRRRAARCLRRPGRRRDPRAPTTSRFARRAVRLLRAGTASFAMHSRASSCRSQVWARRPRQHTARRRPGRAGATTSSLARLASVSRFQTNRRRAQARADRIVADAELAAAAACCQREHPARRRSFSAQRTARLASRSCRSVRG